MAINKTAAGTYRVDFRDQHEQTDPKDVSSA